MSPRAARGRPASRRQGRRAGRWDDARAPGRSSRRRGRGERRAGRMRRQAPKRRPLRCRRTAASRREARGWRPDRARATLDRSRGTRGRPAHDGGSTRPFRPRVSPSRQRRDRPRCRSAHRRRRRGTRGTTGARAAARRPRPRAPPRGPETNWRGQRASGAAASAWCLRGPSPSLVVRNGETGEVCDGLFSAWPRGATATRSNAGRRARRSRLHHISTVPRRFVSTYPPPISSVSRSLLVRVAPHGWPPVGNRVNVLGRAPPEARRAARRRREYAARMSRCAPKCT